MADRISSQGVKYYLGSGSNPRTWALIDGLTGLAASGGEAPEKTATAISDSAPRVIVGTKQAVTVSGECYLDPKDTVHVALNTAYGSGAKCTFKEVLTDTAATTRFFQGFIKNFQLLGTTAVDGVYTTSLSIALDGAVVATEPA